MAVDETGRSTGNNSKKVNQTGAQPMNRSTSDASDGFQMFCNHLCQYYKRKEGIRKTIKECLEEEVKSIAKNTSKISKETNATNNTSTTKKSDAEKTKKYQEKIATFNTEFKKKELDFKKITELIQQKRYIRGKKKDQLMGGSSWKFAQELAKRIDDPEIMAYLKDLVQNCGVWVDNKDKIKLPIAYPGSVRKHAGMGNFKSMDERGFKFDQNPINNLRGQRIQGSSPYKARKIGPGFEACHIWYDTTKAPPIFTFIPNIVWLPQIVARLSDKFQSVENVFFPALLKRISYEIYERRNSRDVLLEGCWEGMEEGRGPSALDDFKPSKENTINAFSLKEKIIKETNNRILRILENIKAFKNQEKKKGKDKIPKDLLEFVEEVQSGKKKVDIPNIIPKKQRKEFEKLNKHDLAGWIYKYYIDFPKDKPSPIKANSNNECWWDDEFLFWIYSEQNRGDTTVPKRFYDKFKRNYLAELKKLILSDEKKIYDLENFLTNYQKYLDKRIQRQKKKEEQKKPIPQEEEKKSEEEEKEVHKKSFKQIEEEHQIEQQEEEKMDLQEQKEEKMDLQEQKEMKTPGFKKKEGSDPQVESKVPVMTPDQLKEFVIRLCNKKGSATEFYTELEEENAPN